jgi:uncharacterized protein DUF736
MCAPAASRAMEPQNEDTARRARLVDRYVGTGEVRLCRDRCRLAQRSAEQRDYLSVKLDDPSFSAPIYANLFDDEEGEGYTLIWSRPQKARTAAAD